ncbi:DUF6888 family protein [Phormidesmis sp. 146-35]
MFPTHSQAITCLILCQLLSNGYRDIHLFRFNDREGYVYFLLAVSLKSSFIAMVAGGLNEARFRKHVS